ncbi:hypothetical protein [Atopococcus tabaci]|uniref:hypothetical protein n=1 Tax=Atopococcus tabaci TaxID=269774 RepID=UPI00041D6AB3|nr:hypothetical protein [Atopococcus tabaci]
MNPIKEGEPVMQGRIFRLTRQVTGETDAHVYGEAGEIVVVTGSHRVMNAFEVLPVDVSLYEKEGYFTPFIVTLDDVASLTEEEYSEVSVELSVEEFLNELIEIKGGAFVFGNLGNRG